MKFRNNPDTMNAKENYFLGSVLKIAVFSRLQAFTSGNWIEY
ncbi:MAG: hypothetical protein ACKVQV_09845 [Bacteroidia bacterium]